MPQKALKNLMENLVKVQRLKDLEVLLYFGFNWKKRMKKE